MASGVELATAWVRLVPTMEGVSDSITKAVVPASGTAGAKGGKTFGSKFKASAAGFLGGALFVAAAKGVADFVSESATSLARIETINTQTAQVIESTGGAANVSAAHVEALAGRLENLTATEAESTQEGANLLLTFKNIQNGVGKGNDIFDQATESLVDMARAMGQDPKAAAVQLGKALNDPIKGISALSRVGITFTEDQQEMIKSMVEAGDVAGAQKIILKELNSQFGGSGQAYASTYAGQLDLMGHAFGTLGETIVGAVMPAFQGLVNFLVPVFQWLSENQPVLIAIAAAIGTLLVAAFIAWTASIWAATAALLANPVTWIIVGIIALIAAIVLLVQNWDAVAAWLAEVWAGFLTWFTSVMDGFIAWWNELWAAVGAWIKSVWEGFIGWITDTWSGFVSWLTGIGDGIAAWWNGLWSGIGSFIQDTWTGFTQWVTDKFNAFLLGVKTIGSAISKWWNGLWSGIGNFFEDIFEGFSGFAKSAFESVLSVIKAPINGIIGLVNSAIRRLNALSVTIPDWVPFVGGQTWGLSLPTIPMLASGATILPRRGGTMAVLAEAGRPETVVDTGLMNRALEQGLDGRSGQPEISDAAMDRLAARVAGAILGLQSAAGQAAVRAAASGAR